jgi:predicted nucleotidyltransferase
MNPTIIDIVKQKLPEIEKEHGVTILYAVESGSRACGFESVDSDYDIRFVYAHTKNWYLNILPKKDVIEYPIENEFDCLAKGSYLAHQGEIKGMNPETNTLQKQKPPSLRSTVAPIGQGGVFDYSGWDLRKTMFLVNKSNPVFFEWLRSPIIYHKDDYFYTIMEQLSKEYFSPVSSIYHYLHMANGNYRQYLQSDTVKIKKYFYVLRPILACMWIENYMESPPMEFEKLLIQITDKELLSIINELLIKKKSGIEFGIEPKIKIINDFVDAMLEHLANAVKTFDPKKKPKQELLENGFIKILENIEKN